MDQRECERKFWANALPPYLDQKPYGDYLTDSLQDPSSLPLPPSDSIYIDPAAGIPDNLDDYVVPIGLRDNREHSFVTCLRHTRQHIPKHLSRRRISRGMTLPPIQIL